MSRNDFQSQVVVVTGASGGIGAAVTAMLAERGASVSAWDIANEGSHFEGRRIGNILPLKVDVTSEEDVRAATALTESELGPIDTLVNVAGVLEKSDALLTDYQSWKRMFAVNADGVFNVSREIVSRMVSRRKGCVVTVSSNAASVPRVGLAAYGASKAASSMFTLSLGLEVAQYGIRCNVVAPGSTRTPMLDATIGKGGSIDDVIRGSLESYRNGIPLQRVAEPIDVAEAVCFLASDRARHISLETLYVDGGATLHGR